MKARGGAGDAPPDGPARAAREAAVRPRPADLIADGLRRRRDARRPAVRLLDATGAATSLDPAEPVAAALLAAAARLAATAGPGD